MTDSANILLIEDNPADSHLISKAFEERCPGAKVFVASDGTAGSDFVFRRNLFAEAPRVDLIMLDLNLPGKDGREVLREIKADPNLKTIPILMFTSSASDTDIRTCYEAGANAYFSKPADLEEFMSLIETIYVHWVKKAKLVPTAIDG